MRKTFSLWLAVLCLLIAPGFTKGAWANDLTSYVNPLMGTQSKFSLSTGNTYPAIAMPWGMNFWTPQTGKMGDGWTYTYTADKIRGFKQTHQPSPWINDYGQFAIMPITGTPEFDEDKRASWFSHKTGEAKPHYYKVYLADHDVVTELTPTERAAMFRFTFPENKQSMVVIDAFDKGSYVKIIPNENKIVGYTTKNSGGVPENFKNYFVIEFDKPFTYTAAVSDGNIEPTKESAQADHAGAIIGFATRKGEVVHARVASSFISEEQALLNLKELDGKSFDELVAQGQQRWNEVLGRIVIEDDNIDNLRTFYSCLYRSLLFPRSFYEYDKDGKVMHYSPYNGKVLPGYMFTDTGFWDTFRSLFPFLNLMYPSVAEKMQEGLVNAYKESNFLPEWASPGHRDCMIGNNSASVVADAYLKGLRNYDIQTLWEAVKHGANNVHPTVSSTGRLGYNYYNELGYVPYDVKIKENAARTLEYAYSDWTIYQLGKALGKPESEIGIYAERAMNYRNVFDPSTSLMRGRNADGSFQSPFNPLKWGDAFTEGNSWHYTWSVFHDPQGLIDLMGGRRAFNQMLDSVFTVPPLFDASYYGQVIHEIREMQIMNMGNYAHGNQPIQHMIYLYNYSGQPWKAQYWTREVMDKLYSPTPDGYCGDEDNGQTSAWYVFSALGFYPVCPGTQEYVIGSPLFKKATLTFENGKQLRLEAPINAKANRYIQSITVDGKSYPKNFFTHNQLTSGGSITYELGAEPNTERGILQGDFPYSFSRERLGLTQYVDPYIGTGDHGHVIMAANVPFGLVQVGPTSIPQTWDWCSGYHISDTTIIGFSHMHLNGTGIGDLSDIGFLPVVGDVMLRRHHRADPDSSMFSYFSRETEVARAGYYAVRLSRYNVDVELTATKRVGFHKYTFPTSDDARVIIDLENGQGWDAPVDSYIVQENDTVISGYRFSRGWARDQRIFFTATFSKPIKKFEVYKQNTLQPGTELKDRRIYGLAHFDTKDTEPVYIKVALSPVSIENAKLNMQAEAPDWDFYGTADRANDAWNEELAKIQIKTDDERVKRTFYTAMYHTMIAPSEYMDVNGDYRGSDKEKTVHRGADFVNYTTFSLWDTYRAAHPLMTIIHPEKVKDMIQTMLTIYEEQGKLPVWHLMSCETDCMVGNPGIPVVADAVLKGFKGFDKDLAFEAMKTSAMLDERGLKYLRDYGYIPYDKEPEGLSKAMEYGIADWSLAQVAKKMGKKEDYNYFMERSKVYKRYFDPESGFVRGVDSLGVFRPNFNPFEAVHRDNDYTEGNAWQYTWLVPHDIEGLVGLFGSKEAFITKLDSLFVVEGSLGEHASPDISGLIGQYAHGNEPSHHIIYMYPYVGQPWKTAEKVREVLDIMYNDEPAGLSGNEDVGQMSAWYILSALGFYQVEPAGGKYVFGSPIVDEAVINVGNGKTLKIVAKNNSPENMYIQSIKLNGKAYNKFYIDFKDIQAGGVLEFTMTSQRPE